MVFDTKAVIMCGISGSGKTTYAHQLEAEGYTRISIDNMVWGEYGDELKNLSPQQQREAYSEANRRVLAKANRLLALGVPVVVDSTMCKRTKRDEIVGLCRSHGVEPVIIYFKVPFDTLSKRLDQRKGTGPDDQLVDQASLAQYYANFEAPDTDENFITIDAWQQ